MRLFLFILVLFSFNRLPAQQFAGEWSGYFQYEYGDFFVPKDKKTFITIKIDSSNNVHSYTKFKNESGRDTVVICRMFFEQQGKNIIKLKEVDESSPGKDEGLQTMTLTLKQQKPPLLSGKWETHFGVAKYTGTIKLTKQEKNNRIKGAVPQH